ncbi:MAG: c-type cytochrome [Gammaproteobacteria bacterium]|nr:c-type cytochrome [Gammaproteobacteria bacterium]
MGTLIRVLSFSLGLALVFTLIANLLPQVEGEAPVEEEVDLSSLDMDTFVALGESTFTGKGTCTLCHNDMGRAPDLLNMDVVAVSAERMQDERYVGTASNVTDYIRESMVAPGVYVVAGFGKKGSNDSESPMPDVSAAPIQLSAVEVDAIIAYLQAKDGHEVSVALPTLDKADMSAASVGSEPVPAAPVAAATPEAALAKFGCSACHSVLATESPVGPDLRNVGSRLSRQQIRMSILDPMAEVAEGFPPIMPNLADQMMVTELEMLVQFLAEQKQ